MACSDELGAIFRKHAKTLVPKPTGLSPKLKSLPDIRAVLFDVYGTLFISGSGDVGTLQQAAKSASMKQTLIACGLKATPTDDLIATFFNCIEQSHLESRHSGIDHPEIDIRQIWRQLVRRLGIDDNPSPELCVKLAAEYEARVNPVWPMPGCQPVVADLRGRGKCLGIVSNAQFFTPALFEAFLGRSTEYLGFDPSVCFYSYALKHAKPGVHLYKLASEALAKREIEPKQCLYVGNDMLNDVWPASIVGFRTALFAGDQRSLRLRENDERCIKLKPDLILTELQQLVECVE